MLTQPFGLCRGADFFPIADVPMAVIRYASAVVTRHGHDFCEMVLVSKGTGRHELFAPNSDIPTAVQLTQGSLIFIPLGWSHAYSEVDHLEIFNVIFDRQVLATWPKSNELLCYGAGALNSPAMWSLQRSEGEYLETLLRNIMRELTGRQRGFELAAHAKLAEVLVWVDRLNFRQGEKRMPESQLSMSKAVAFMEQHFAEPIALDDIARTAHLSTHYFCEVFKNAIGLSPGRYLLRLRLEHARFLLLTTTMPVSQVAQESGFADASYFARAFKSTFGTAPTRLRRSGR
jgi:AraC-like DNA-binding protein